jgi:hypothetical protein
MYLRLLLAEFQERHHAFLAVIRFRFFGENVMWQKAAEKTKANHG